LRFFLAVFFAFFFATIVHPHSAESMDARFSFFRRGVVLYVQFAGLCELLGGLCAGLYGRLAGLSISGLPS
jgi:hypothetical protein